MAILKQSTAYTRTFLMIDSTDHITGKTSIAPSPDTLVVSISKNGGSFAVVTGTRTEISNGWYKVALSSGDTDTLGDLAFHITASGADPTDFVDQVSARLIDDLAYPATSGRSMVVDASGLVDANAVKIGASGAGNATAPINLAKTTNAIARGTATTGGTTTSVPTSALSIAGSSATGVVADQFKNRIVLFDGDTTTAGLRGAQATISASSASNTPTLTVGTLPDTPASGDTFSVI